MANRKRTLLAPTDDWQQLQFQLDWLEQRRYELLRPVVVFGSAPVERAEQAEVSARTVYRRVERFDELGMRSPSMTNGRCPRPTARRSSGSRPSPRPSDRVHDFNSQEHWAHLKHQDGRRSPAEVLDWVKGRAFSDRELARIFVPLPTGRRVDQQGYVRFRNWRLHGERDLAGAPIGICVKEALAGLMGGCATSRSTRDRPPVPVRSRSRSDRRR
jgi:hypothetical protein